MTDAPNTEPTPDTSEVEPPAEPDWKVEAERLKTESRKWETRAKDNAKAAQRLAEFEEANKSDLEKFQSRAEVAEKRLAEIEVREQIAGWKAEIATGTGVPADALRGTTREELEAHAEALKPLLTASQRGPFVPSPGNIPDNPVSDNAAFARKLFGSGS